MFFAITALAVSAVQIFIGVAIGLSLRKNRQRQLLAGETVRPAGQRRPTSEPSAAGSPEPKRQPDAESTFASEAGGTDLAPAAPGVSARGESTPKHKQRSDAPMDERALATYQPEPAPQTTGKPPAAAPAGKDRRVFSRRAFEFRQNLAPYHGGQLPGKAAFREVDCQDISSTGFSFLSSQLPDFDSIVVALGAAPQLVYLHAQIVNRFQIDDGPAPLFRIGCRFIGQVGS